MPSKMKPVAPTLSSLFALFVISVTLTSCSFFVPAYDTPDSNQYQKQKEKARDELKKEAHNDPVPK
jgi:hypothetical protein